MPVSLEERMKKICLVNQQRKCPISNPILQLSTDSLYVELPKTDAIY